jgi:hypothetical protein
MVKELKVEFSQKPVSPWGGLKVMKDMVDKTGVKDFLGKLDLPKPGSNRGYNPIDVIESFWVSTWISAQNFSHCHWIRDDDVLKEIFGWSSTPSQSTYSRFFKRFSWRRNNEVFEPLQRWFMDQLRVENITVDLDSCVITRYGNQEGAHAGYNPGKHGRNSHHPLMAFMSQMRMVINSWLRSGDTHDKNNYQHFLGERLRILANKKIGLIRMDSGFYSTDVLDYLEERSLNYITAVKLYPSIKKLLRGTQNWRALDDGLQVCEFYWQMPGWQEPRRFVAVRKNIRNFPKAGGKTLFPDQYQTWRYSVFVTNLDLPAEEICRTYWNRGDAENRIKELKSDFGLDNYSLNDFWGTEAAQRFMMVAYNLMSIFRQAVLQSSTQAFLKTIRFKCYAVGSWITKSGRNQTLKLSMTKNKVQWMEGLFSKAQSASPPYYHAIGKP